MFHMFILITSLLARAGSCRQRLNGVCSKLVIKPAFQNVSFVDSNLYCIGNVIGWVLVDYVAHL